ncbi:MAG: DUF4282 domain-containing protein [Armatimonadota bacterium]
MAKTANVEQGRGGYYSFRTMVSPMLIKIIYVPGMLAIILGGIYLTLQIITGQFSDYITITIVDIKTTAIIIGVLGIIVGNIVWRVICEVFILLFSMHEVLVQNERLLGSIQQQLAQQQVKPAAEPVKAGTAE